MFRVNPTKSTPSFLRGFPGALPCPITQEEMMTAEKSEALMNKRCCVVEFLSSAGFWYCIFVELAFIVVAKFEN